MKILGRLLAALFIVPVLALFPPQATPASPGQPEVVEDEEDVQEGHGLNPFWLLFGVAVVLGLIWTEGHAPQVWEYVKQNKTERLLILLLFVRVLALEKRVSKLGTRPVDRLHSGNGE